MKLNTVEKVCHVLKTGENEVHVSDETRLKSLVPLDKMLANGKIRRIYNENRYSHRRNRR